MSNIKVFVATGTPLPSAIKAALAMSVREFAEKHQLHESAVSGLINGSTPYRQERVREALATELEVEREWLDELLDQQAAERAST